MALLGQNYAKADRQSGAMPSYVQKRDDGDALWNAFQCCHYLSWTGRDVDEFMKGWDARGSFDA